MHMIDMPERQECVQQRFDRWSARCRIEQRPSNQIGHFLIGHLFAVTKRRQLG
jgi:hypothetical protein